jgi:hypothetical protein
MKICVMDKGWSFWGALGHTNPIGPNRNTYGYLVQTSSNIHNFGLSKLPWKCLHNKVDIKSLNSS